MANVDVFSGNTKRIIVTVKDASGTVVNVSSLSAANFAIAEAPAGRSDYVPTPIFTKTLLDGIAITDGLNGILTVTLSPADTEGLEGDYIYEMELVESTGDVSTILSDVLQIRPTIIPNN